MMRRTPMARGAGFKRPAYTPRPAREQDDTPSAALDRSRAPCNAVMTPVQCMVSPIAKENALRSEPYRRLVAALPCAYCRKEGRSQHAHTNGANKGKGIKNDDRDAMPLCADEPYSVGCHRLFDLYRLIPGGRDAHRRMGERMAAETRALIEASGQWPQSLERLPK
jgi:hypothetical protein